jgi:hypothetical protein
MSNTTDKKEAPLVETEEVKAPKAPKEGESDFNDYQRFAELKFLQWDGRGYERKRLKPSTLELFDTLEKKFKNYKGKKPKKSATAFLGIGKGNGRVVEGYGVPASLYQAFKDAKIEKRYF